MRAKAPSFASGGLFSGRLDWLSGIAARVSRFLALLAGFLSVGSSSDRATRAPQWGVLNTDLSRAYL